MPREIPAGGGAAPGEGALNDRNLEGEVRRRVDRDAGRKVVGGEEVAVRPLLTHHAVDQTLGFFLEGQPQLAVELGIHVLDRCRAFEPAELQPLG